MAAIENITARPILDSRGEWTIETEVILSDGACGVASVPQGKSTGAHEAAAVPAAEAVENTNGAIAQALTGCDPREQDAIDRTLIELDGSEGTHTLGANAILGASLACARAAAALEGKALHAHLRKCYGSGEPLRRPHLYMNMINGGVHAANNLRIQEYLVVIDGKSAFDVVSSGAQFYQELKRYLARKVGESAVHVGDEGGFAPVLTDDFEPLAICTRVAEALGIDDRIMLGIDAAANSISASPEELHEMYVRMQEEHGVSYIEDPFTEEDFEHFARLTADARAGTAIVGDDLTVTNAARINEAAAREAVNGVIIKPNQIGTLSQAFAAVRAAREHGWRVVCSHRSGETNDDWIIDLALAVSADGIKIGAPARGERTAKYNRFLSAAP